MCWCEWLTHEPPFDRFDLLFILFFQKIFFIRWPLTIRYHGKQRKLHFLLVEKLFIYFLIDVIEVCFCIICFKGRIQIYRRIEKAYETNEIEDVIACQLSVWQATKSISREIGRREWVCWRRVLRFERERKRVISAKSLLRVLLLLVATMAKQWNAIASQIMSLSIIADK